MGYVMVVLLLILVAGLIALPMLRRSSGRADADTIDTRVTPPAHPREPLPGSATRRHKQGRP